MPRTAQLSRNIARDVATQVIRLVEENTRTLVLDPDAAVSDRMRASMRQVLDAAESLLATDASVVSREYGLRQAGVEDIYARARHQLDLLDRLHGPQAAGPSS